MLVCRAWVKAAPVENFLRVLVCLRILIRDVNLQKRFVEQDGVAIVTQVHSSVTYLLRIVSDIATFVLKRDVKLQLTN